MDAQGNYDADTFKCVCGSRLFIRVDRVAVNDVVSATIDGETVIVCEDCRRRYIYQRHCGWTSFIRAGYNMKAEPDGR